MRGIIPYSISIQYVLVLQSIYVPSICQCNSCTCTGPLCITSINGWCNSKSHQSTTPLTMGAQSLDSDHYYQLMCVDLIQLTLLGHQSKYTTLQAQLSGTQPAQGAEALLHFQHQILLNRSRTGNWGIFSAFNSPLYYLTIRVYCNGMLPAHAYSFQLPLYWNKMHLGSHHTMN
jgi:hypothetical protein